MQLARARMVQMPYLKKSLARQSGPGTLAISSTDLDQHLREVQWVCDFPARK